jgi:hypothetical protein
VHEPWSGTIPDLIVRTAVAFNAKGIGPSAPTAQPATTAPAAATPRATSPANSTSRASDFSRFAGTWSAHTGSIEVHADGSAKVVSAPPPGSGLPGGTLTIQFTTATPTVASGHVVTSSLPAHSAGEPATLVLNGDDTVSLGLGAVDPRSTLPFCGPQTPVGYCGA